MNPALRIPPIASKLEARLIAEYGAIFATSAVPPSKIIFADEAEVSTFQASLKKLKHAFGGFEIELQAQAMDALKAAADQAAEIGLSISPRAADSGSRSYAETLALWSRNVNRGLEHWLHRGVLLSEQVSWIRSLPPTAQVEAILDLEDSRGIFFSTYFDKSILYSVAAPGASQHLAMLAFDLAEFANQAVDNIMRSHGWYRTVVTDLPHFTYLGHDESLLPELGLMKVVRESDGRPYHFWILKGS